MIKYCEICNKPFKTYQSKIKIGKGRFCSKKCSNIGQSHPPNSGSFKKGQHCSPETEFKKGHTLNKGKPKPNQRREKHPCWKGGQHIKYGYVYILSPFHPRAEKSGYVKRANVVMEYKINRFLNKEEVVHHINGNRSDDRPCNLQLFSNSSDHMKHHHNLRRKKSTQNCALH